MRLRALAILPLALVAECPSDYPGLTRGEVAAIQAGVKAQLTDPDSAIFSGLTAEPESPSARNVCGWVNARNRMGGYAGKAAFYGFVLDGIDGPIFNLYRIESALADGSDRATILHLCRTGRAPLD